LFVSARIVIEERETAVTLPPGALVTFAGIEKVVTVKEGKAIERTVTSGRRGSGWVEVVSGLAAGEAVVSEPGGLRTGQPVQVVGEAPPATAAVP
jgi:membrane fusion protein (multidrug efflux system)